MIIREIQILAEALWESVKNDLKFFSSIQSFVRKLSDYNFSELTKEKLPEVQLYTDKIEKFFSEYRSSSDSDVFFSAPPEILNNDETVIQIGKLVHKLASKSKNELDQEIQKLKPEKRSTTQGQGYIFLGHGRSALWSRLKVFLEEEKGLTTLSYETEPHISENILDVLSEMLDRASYAVLIMTGEDLMSDGKPRARQNVIHELGLFQGRLGFDKVVLLKQEGTEEFSNVAGLQYISFSDNSIEQAFYHLERYLRKANLIK